MAYSAYYTELNLEIYKYEQKQRICRENSKYASGEMFSGHICPRRKAANFCHPARQLFSQMRIIVHSQKQPFLRLHGDVKWSSWNLKHLHVAIHKNKSEKPFGHFHFLQKNLPKYEIFHQLSQNIATHSTS